MASASLVRSTDRRNSVTTGPLGYTITAEIGRGVFGVVFRGVDPRGNDCAMKHVHLTSPVVRAEIAMLSQLHPHPNLVRVLEVSEDHKKPDFVWYVIDFCTGPTLNDYILSSVPKIDVSLKLKLILDVANALQYLHSKNLLHRNLKPDNIFVSGFEGGEGIVTRCKVADFGLAHIWEANTTLPTSYYTKTSHSFGPPFYTAPEVRELKIVTDKCDIYSLGMLLLGSILETTAQCLWAVEKEMLVPIINDQDIEEATPLQIQKAMEDKGVRNTQLIQIVIHMLSVDHERRPNIFEVCSPLLDALFAHFNSR
ncbi:serine/threonine-protein kinase PDIK1L-like [Lingula anatina]|uniref:Serine/threonine-protein kinase PDIK1L-like n=1 Tax=Lingula anatina TaxID=7574 RepID=A0A1S3JZQ5_LINAN|nr:serine/threonine-protein kinase PDIK1L-like [Lingula anatina]|eukprot:XP_013415584.1 serine/threonine-protein kinase PDIK1L-like [Lingula anatina]